MKQLVLQGSLVAWWTLSPRPSTRLEPWVPVDTRLPRGTLGTEAVTLTVFLCFILLPQLDEGPMGEPEGSFVDYQTTMVKTAKAIAVTVQEMVSLGHKRTALRELSLVRTLLLPLLLGNQVKHQP